MVSKKQNEGEGSRNRRHACMACKQQRRRCRSECGTAPYFPAEGPIDFEVIHKIFGVSNITKWLASLHSDANMKAASDSFKWEASEWKRNPVRGPLGAYEDLLKKFKEVVDKSKELSIKGQGVVQGQLNHNTPIHTTTMWSTSQLQDYQHQFVQNNIDNVNVSHPNKAFMNIGRHGHGHGHGCPPLSMMNNYNNIDPRYLMMESRRMDSPAVSYNYEPQVHDDYGRQTCGRGYPSRPNSMLQPPQELSVNVVMPYFNNNNSNLFHGAAGSSSSLGPSISNNIGNYGNMPTLPLDQNEHDGGVPSNHAAAINPHAQPFHVRPSPPPPTQVRRSTQATHGVHSPQQQRHQQHLRQRYSGHQSSNNQVVEAGVDQSKVRNEEGGRN